jgi:hypothetical protein
MPHDHAIHQLIKMACTVRHSDPGDVDEYGDHPVGVITETTERCYIAQSTRGENDDIETERWQVYFLPYVLVDANDSVFVDGMEMQILGNPWLVCDPVTGWRTHIEATAVRRI